AWISTRPRRAVGQLRTSTVLRPCTNSAAHGCFNDRAYGVTAVGSLPECVAPFYATAWFIFTFPAPNVNANRGGHPLVFSRTIWFAQGVGSPGPGSSHANTAHTTADRRRVAPGPQAHLHRQPPPPADAADGPRGAVQHPRRRRPRPAVL